LTGLASLFAAPAIVRPENLMKIVAPRPARMVTLAEYATLRSGEEFAFMEQFVVTNVDTFLYGDATVPRYAFDWLSRRRLTVGSRRADEDFGQATGKRGEFEVLDPIDVMDPSPGFPPFRGP
jgi:hypothetical protein